MSPVLPFLASVLMAGCSGSALPKADGPGQAQVLKLLSAAESGDSSTFQSMTKSAVFRLVEFDGSPRNQEDPDARAVALGDIITRRTKIKSDGSDTYAISHLTSRDNMVSVDYECPSGWSDCYRRMNFVLRDGQIVEIQDVFLGLGG